MNMLRPMTASELIDALGGNSAVAAIAGVKPNAVSNWRKFGAIPPRLYISMSAAGREQGIQVPERLFRELSDEERAA